MNKDIGKRPSNDISYLTRDMKDSKHLSKVGSKVYIDMNELRNEDIHNNKNNSALGVMSAEKNFKPLDSDSSKETSSTKKNK